MYNNSISDLNNKYNTLNSNMVECKNSINTLNSNLPLQNYINLWDTPIIPSEINVYYTYTNTILKGKKCIFANFQSSVGNILVSYAGHSTGIVNAKSDNQYWGGEIQCTFDSDTGTISFNVIWIGQSQTISNFKLTGILY